MALRLDVAILVALITQAVAYGGFQVMFVAAIYVLLYAKTASRVNWTLVATAFVLWLLIGLNFAFSWSRVMDAFVVLQLDLPANPDAINEYLEDLGKWKEVARTAVVVGVTTLGDSLLIYRLYIVWGRRLIVLIPVVMLLGSMTAGFGIVGVLSRGSTLFASKIAPWIPAYFGLSLAQNIVTTSLIVYRIWRVNLDTGREIRSSPFWPVVMILLESGALYSTNHLVLLVTYLSGSLSQYIALDMLPPVTGITFSMIIVRAGLGLTKKPVTLNMTSRRQGVTASGVNSGVVFALQRFQLGATDVTRTVDGVYVNREVEVTKDYDGAIHFEDEPRHSKSCHR